VLSKEGKKEKLSCNLLMAEGCGPGKHHFPKEDNVGILYPREVPTVFERVLNTYHPISSKRIVKVKSFYVVITVNSYQMNETDSQKLESMNVTVEFKNRLK
jgi:hypothetical protein